MIHCNITIKNKETEKNCGKEAEFIMFGMSLCNEHREWKRKDSFSLREEEKETAKPKKKWWQFF